MSLVSDLAGDVLFSPLTFTASQLSPNLEESALSQSDLIALGQLEMQIKDKFSQASQSATSGSQ